MKSDARLGDRLPRTLTPSTGVRGGPSVSGSCSNSTVMMVTLRLNTDRAQIAWRCGVRSLIGETAARDRAGGSGLGRRRTRPPIVAVRRAAHRLPPGAPDRRGRPEPRRRPGLRRGARVRRTALSVRTRPRGLARADGPVLRYAGALDDAALPWGSDRDRGRGRITEARVLDRGGGAAVVVGDRAGRARRRTRHAGRAGPVRPGGPRGGQHRGGGPQPGPGASARRRQGAAVDRVGD